MQPEMKHLKSTTSCFFKVLLLFLFIGYNSSITLFYHAHLLNGQIVFHSHPYKHNKESKNPFESHKHTSKEFFQIQQHNKTVWEDTPEISPVPEFLDTPTESIIAYISPFLSSDTNFSTQLRAPPYSSFLS
jgi:uncharacterized protein YegP (UPF0339 family)